MESPIAYRKSQLPYTLLLILIGITFMLVWLPLLRCLMDGTSYQWGMDFYGRQFSSAGLSTDYLFLVVQLVFFVGLFYSFFWVKNRNIFYGMLGLWFLNTLGNFLFGLIKDGDAMFHGETLGVHISVSSIVITLACIALACIAWVISKDRRQEESAIPWGRRNRIWAIIVLIPLPFQWIMFATGKPHETTDEIAVLIAIAQAFLIPFIFEPKVDRGN